MYKLLLASLFLAVFSTSAAKIIDDEHVTKKQTASQASLLTMIRINLLKE